MMTDKNLTFDTLTNDTATAYSSVIDLGQDNLGDGVVQLDFYAICQAVPAAGDPDSTFYAFSLQFSDAGGESFSASNYVPMFTTVNRKTLAAGKFVGNARPLLKIPNRYCRVACIRTGTAVTGASWDFGFALNAKKPDAFV